MLSLPFREKLAALRIYPRSSQAADKTGSDQQGSDGDQPNPEAAKKRKMARILAILLIVAIVLTTVIAVPTVLHEKRANASSTVYDGAATYKGSCSSTVCGWLGVRYAQAPIGNLRFAPARAPSPAISGTQTVTKYGPQCLQNDTAPMSEDCLFANIFRPAGTSLKTKLPVVLFAHGGGFQAGSGSAQDVTALVKTSSSNKSPVLVMTFNYRLGLFGFLGGSTFAQRAKANNNDVTLNAGFTDVRQAIAWAKKHISAFGGDPDQITVWGQSAGSFAVSAQLLGSYKNPPFARVFLESGSPGGVPIDAPSVKDSQFTSVTNGAGCFLAADVVACLRAASSADLLKISVDQTALSGMRNEVPRGYYAWTPVNDGGPAQNGFFSDRPSQVIAAGNYANVPILHGDCYDEGTYFALQSSNDTTTTAQWFSRIYFGNSMSALEKVLAAYPDDPVVGSPFKPVNGDYSNRFYGIENQYKRIAAIYGDVRYQANRRLFLTAAAKRGLRIYSFEFAQYVQGNADSIGFPHGSDQAFWFNTQKNNIYKDLLTRQAVSFIAYGDPNRIKGLPKWPQYTSDTQQLMYYANKSTSVIPDTFRADAINVLNSADVLLASGR